MLDMDRVGPWCEITNLLLVCLHLSVLFSMTISSQIAPPSPYRYVELQLWELFYPLSCRDFLLCPEKRCQAC